MAGLKAVQMPGASLMKQKECVIGQPAADPILENAVPKDI